MADSNDHEVQSPCSTLPQCTNVRGRAKVNGKLRKITSNLNNKQIQVRTRSLQRLIAKNGKVNVKRFVTNRWWVHSRDYFTTIVDTPTINIIGIFFASYIISWWFFGFVWWVIGSIRGDFTLEHVRDAALGNYTPCVENNDGFFESLLFSIETQTTIGYGVRAVTRKCAEGIIALQVQTIIGYLIDSFALGIFFVKLSQSKRRAYTLKSSKYAIISKRDGQTKLMIRIGNMRKSPIYDIQVNGFLYKDRTTPEGEALINHPHQVEFECSYAFLLTPITLCHVIDESSPFYGMEQHDLIEQRAEIVIVIEGVVESTGLTTQYRTSYTADEIQFGVYFLEVVKRTKHGQVKIDFSLFDALSPIPTSNNSNSSEDDESNEDKQHSFSNNQDMKFAISVSQDDSKPNA